MRSRLVVVSRCEILCAGLTRLLVEHSELQLVAAISGYARATLLVKRLKPEAVVVDVGVDEGEAMQLIHELASGSRARVVAMLEGSSAAAARRSISAGAQDLAYRSGSLAELTRAVLPPGGTGRLPAAHQPPRHDTRMRPLANAPVLAARLNRLERGVLRLIGDGQNHSTIRKQLRVSSGDYQRVFASLATMAGASTTAQLTRLALRLGLTRLNTVRRGGEQEEGAAARVSQAAADSGVTKRTWRPPHARRP
jgi:DNA-binding NarL/FixJ family response regulator